MKTQRQAKIMEIIANKNVETQEQLLQELDRETHRRMVAPRMLSGHLQGKLLKMLTRMMRPKRILEIGTFTGYSALSMAAGLEEGAYIDTCEVDDELEMIAADFFERSGLGDKIRQHIGSALEIAPKLGEKYDLVFIDGERVEMSPKEYDLFFYMLQNRNIAISREKFISDVWGYDFFGDDRTLDTHIKLLRKNLGEYSRLIVTLRGVGYRFEAE